MTHDKLDIFVNQLGFVRDMHEKLRRALPQKDDHSHFVNENTVIRMCAVLEANKVFAPSKEADQDATDAEICVRTLFLFRNIILHEPAGQYEPSKLTPRGRRHISAYEKFCEHHPKAHVDVGQILCLASKEVLAPLLAGCIEYVSDQC